MGTDINFRKHLNRTYGTNVSLAFDPMSSAYFVATGITGYTQQTAIDNLVKGLKQDGLWSKMKAVYPFVTDNRNLLSYTDNFANGFWGVGNGAVKTPNFAAAPDGTITACRFNGGGFLNSGVVNVVAGTNLFSFYAKTTSGGTSTIRVFLDGGTTTTTKTITGTWTRIETTQNFASNQAVGVGFYLDSSDLLIWHPQVELGSTATTYQPIATTQQAFISNQFKYNLVNPVDSDAAFRLVFNGGWTHSANGATPNGTNGYADTFFNPNTQLSLTNSHISLYKNFGVISGTDKANGVYNSTTDFGLYPDRSNSLYSSGCLGSYSPVNTIVGSNSSVQGNGFYIIARNANNFVRLNKNNTNTLTNTNTNSSASLPNDSFWLGGSHFSGTTLIISPNNYRYAMLSLGEYLDATEAANLYTRVQAFQTALSRQV